MAGSANPPEPVPFHEGQEPEVIDSVTMYEWCGRLFPLRLDLATMVRFEKATGINMLVNSHILRPRNLSMSAILHFLWAGMSQYDETLSVDDVGRGIDPAHFEEAGEAVHNMIMKAFPDPEPAKTPSANGTDQKKTE